MNWKYVLQKLEETNQWDEAIEFMEEVIRDHPNNVDAYLSMNYLLMNLIVEESYARDRHDYFAQKLEDYYFESSKKFLNNPEYLFFTAITAYMSEWYFELELEEAREMLWRALYMQYTNTLFMWALYGSLELENPANLKLAVPYAKMIGDEQSEIRKQLKLKGSLGKYLLGLMTGWSQRVLAKSMGDIKKV